MNPFIQKHSATVTGILSGFDRLVFRGYLKSLAYPAGMKSYLYSAGVLLKDFAQFVQFSTRQIVTAATEVAEQHARPVLYLPFSRVSKEAFMNKFYSDATSLDTTVEKKYLKPIANGQVPIAGQWNNDLCTPNSYYRSTKFEVNDITLDFAIHDGCSPC